MRHNSFSAHGLVSIPLPAKLGLFRMIVRRGDSACPRANWLCFARPALGKARLKLALFRTSHFKPHTSNFPRIGFVCTSVHPCQWGDPQQADNPKLALFCTTGKSAQTAITFVPSSSYHSFRPSANWLCLFEGVSHPTDQTAGGTPSRNWLCFARSAPRRPRLSRGNWVCFARFVAGDPRACDSSADWLCFAYFSPGRVAASRPRALGMVFLARNPNLLARRRGGAEKGKTEPPPSSASRRLCARYDFFCLDDFASGIVLSFIKSCVLSRTQLPIRVTRPRRASLRLTAGPRVHGRRTLPV